MPERVQAAGTTELTGNHYLSFPRIQQADAGVSAVSAMHAGLGGVVSWEGDPLLRVRAGLAGSEPCPLTNLQWQRLDRWIPQARTTVGGMDVTVTICAPGGYDPLARGGFVLCDFHNRSGSDGEVDLVLDSRMHKASLHVVRPRPLHTPHRGCTGALHRGIAFEVGVPSPAAALGITCDDPAAEYTIGSDPDGDCSVAQGETLTAAVATRVRIRSGRTVRRAFFLGVGRDADSALAHAAHLAGIGAPDLLRQARLELAQLARRMPDVGLSEIVNRNLLFNHYYALARAFDDDRLYAVTSRSPGHVPGAAVNERELLFWTVPCITLMDPLLARELLRDAFELYSAQPGLKWRYMDGGVLEPGFCLEQVLLYPLAVDRYVRETGDDTLLDDPLIQDVLREIDGGLDGYVHEDLLLCRTELLPGGEVADQPYPTLGNIMLWAYADALPRIWRGEEGEAPASFDGTADDVASAVWQRCMADVEGAQVFVSTTDLRSRSAVYDDPAMSLSLIPFFGFCPQDDPTWRETLTLLRSARYPFWRGGPCAGLSSRRHPEHASTAALCADLLGPRRDAALAVVRKLQLQDGFASDRYDPASGEPAGEPHAAALAGFLAWSIIHALEGPAKKVRKPAK